MLFVCITLTFFYHDLEKNHVDRPLQKERLSDREIECRKGKKNSEKYGDFYTHIVSIWKERRKSKKHGKEEDSAQKKKNLLLEKFSYNE